VDGCLKVHFICFQEEGFDENTYYLMILKSLYVADYRLKLSNEFLWRTGLRPVPKRKIIKEPNTRLFICPNAPGELGGRFRLTGYPSTRDQA